MSYAPILPIVRLHLQKKKKKKGENFTLFSRANIIQRKFTIFVSQTFLSERTQVFWLNKILLKTCFHGYRASLVSAINTSSAIKD